MSDTHVSPGVLAAARRLAERSELSRASMADIAAEAGLTRVTLYRRGETRVAIISALRGELAREERERLLPILAADADARTRLTDVIGTLCAIAELRAELLTGLDDATLNAIYHDPDAEALTRTEFAAPIIRLLRDGARDGSLREFADPAETATVIYTQVFYAFLHLRRDHGWTAERTTAAVVDLTIGGVLPTSALSLPPRGG